MDKAFFLKDASSMGNRQPTSARTTSIHGRQLRKLFLHHGNMSAELVLAIIAAVDLGFK